MSILGEEEVHFDDPDLEEERRQRTKFLLEKMASLPSHREWFDEEIFEQLVIDYVKCQIHIRELDNLIMNDPVTYGALDRVRNNTVTRFAKLGLDLGLTATKLNSLKPRTPKQLKGGLEALADIDFVE